MKKTFSLLFLCLSFPLTALSQGITVSASGVETTYSFEATVRSTNQDSIKPNGQEIAVFHSGHVFGVFHSASFAEKFGFPEDLNEGFVGAKYPTVKVKSVFKKPGDTYWSVTYSAQGQALVLNRVLEQWERRGRGYQVKLPMLVNLPSVYSDSLDQYSDPSWKDCSDPDYPKALDFSYFYDPFRCSELAEAPVGEEIEFQFEPTAGPRVQTEFPSAELNGDNGNGRLQVLYFALGFDGTLKSGSTDAKIKRDDGYRIFKSFAKRLVQDFDFVEQTSESDFKKILGAERSKLNFTSPVSMDNFTQRRFYKTFVKDVDGRLVVVRMGLFDSQNQSSQRPLKSFPNFWREAWANGDLIYYGGHSGDGIAMDRDRLLSTLEADDFRTDSRSKIQVGFLDGCSTYAYYQDMYKELLPNTLHLMTYGVVSLYHAAEITMVQMLSEILTADPSREWSAVLHDIEKAQLLPHYQFLYGAEDGQRRASQKMRQDLYPSFLLNVWVP